MLTVNSPNQVREEFAMAIRPTFVNVSSSRGVSAIGIQVLSSNPNPSAVLHGMAQVSQQESTRNPYIRREEQTIRNAAT